MSNVLRRSLVAAKISSHLELSDIYRSDGIQPDGMSIVSWKWGRSSGVGCHMPGHPDPLLYEHLATREAGAVAAEMSAGGV